METLRTRSVLGLLVVLCLCATACGSTGDDGSSATADLSTPISEQDLDEARRVFDAAKAQWEGVEAFDYTFAAGVETINLIEVDFDVDGVASPERVVFGEANPDGWATVPRSVDEAFSAIGLLLATFESGEFEVPGGGDCGQHFNAEFDPQFGAPHYYDTLGPCDTGAGIRMTVTPAGADGPVPPEEPCDQGAYVGTWLSPRAAGTEPLDPDDGVGDEGGSGVVVLTLADGESMLQSADTIEVIGEWFCSGTTLIAISGAGQERELATINDDGTLTVGSVVLSRADE